MVFTLTSAQENLNLENVSIDINNSKIQSLNNQEIIIHVGADDYDTLYLEGKVIAQDSEVSTIELSQKSISNHPVLENDVIVKVKTQDLYFKLSKEHRYFGAKFLSDSNGADGTNILSNPKQYKIIGYNTEKQKYLFNMSYIHGFGAVNPLFSKDELFRVLDKPRPLTYLTSVAKVHPRLIAENKDKLVVAVTELTKGIYRYEYNTKYYIWDFKNKEMSPEEFKPVIRKYGLYFKEELEGKKIIHFNYRGDGFLSNYHIASYEFIKQAVDDVYVRDLISQKVKKINKKYIIKPSLKLACSKIFKFKEFQ